MKELFCIKKSLHSRGSVLIRWDPTNKYLATIGQNRRCNVHDRNGNQIDEFALTGKPTNTPMQVEWDKDGENLAVLCDGQPNNTSVMSHSVVALWNVYEKKSTSFETNLKDPSFMAWSRVGPQLAIGTAKGSLLIYNSDTKKSNLIQGKHSKKITCGMWNLENRLALASLDKTMSINDEKGELLEQPKLKYDPFDVQFAEQKVDEKQGPGKENTVSVNMGHQTILMYNMTDQDNPVELAFQPKYGDIATYKWFGDGYMMVGFSKGYIIAISTHMKEIGEELQSLKIHEQQLVDVAYSSNLNRLATCGDDGVRVVDMSDWKEMKSEHKEFNREEGDPERMEWTKDGQILSVATSGGYVFNFLMSIPVLSAHYQTKMVYLSSLRHVSIVDQAQDGASIVSLEIAIEPSFLALGSEHVAVGMNNHCWFHTWNVSKAGKDGLATMNQLHNQPVHEREYLGSVRQIVLNDLYAAVLLDNGKINLHLIANDAENERDSKIFPDEKDETSKDGSPIRITGLVLTNDFLIYSTSRGTLHHFYLKDWSQVVEHRHDVPISTIYSNPLGTRLIFFDSQARSYLYSPIEDYKFEISSNFPPASSLEKILFDDTDSNTFVTIDTKNTRTITTFTYSSQTTKGPSIQKIPSLTKLPNGFNQVVMFHDGNIHGQRSTGGLVSITLASHDALTNNGGNGGGGVGVGKPNLRSSRNSDKLRTSFQQLLSLNRLKGAWELSLQLKSRECLIQLGKRALDQLDIELAIRVYRELKDTSMVLALQQILGIEDKDLLSGHILLLQGDYTYAQKLFLSSSNPQQALQMRRDLLNWEMALKLASQLAPNEIPSICKEYAQSLEVKGDYQQALAMYQRALTEDPAALGTSSSGKSKSQLTKDHLKTVNGGIARMTLRVGDLQKGRSLALSSGDKILMKDCGSILEHMKQYPDAADMYVQAEQYEKAASIYNMTMNFAKSGPLMDKITTPKIHLQYAKAKESQKDYGAAAIAYEKAKDMDSVIRLNLAYLDNAEKAFQIVRLTKSAEGAALVAQYCQQHNNFQAAIEFLLLAKRSEEAFKMAQQHHEMDKYCKALGEDGTFEEYTQIAIYYEDEKDYANAGHYYSKIGDYTKSIKLFLQCDTQQIDAAIGVVKKAQGQPGSELLVRQLHDFLIGESDGKVKDLNYIFRLYMAIGEFGQAANTAILIASQEQQNGQYSVAHSILFAMHQDLSREKLPIPNELRRNLLLLHSYTLAKKMSVKKEHDSAARMLIRVAKNISKFPSHVVPILTSTVIECQRAGLKKDSLEYAKILLRPEHKSKIMAQYLKPIEGFVRRPPSQEELEKERAEKSTPCPYCAFELPETLLDCPGCKNNLPYCITTGKHMVLSDWTECPSCKFPTLYSSFVSHISTSADKKCCMCDGVINVADVLRIKDPKSKLFQQQQQGEQRQTEEEANAQGAASASASAAGPSRSVPFDAVDIQPIFK